MIPNSEKGSKMKLKKKFLVYKIERRKHIPVGDKLFCSEEKAWEWVDTKYKSDEDRLKFYLADVMVVSSAYKVTIVL